MKSLSSKIVCVAVSILVGSVFCLMGRVSAEEASDAANETKELMEAATSISISPVSKVLQLEENKVYDDTFTIKNNGTTEMRFEVYASPYSYTFSESDNEYKLGFSNENNYTQITRWITFKDRDGNYVKNPQFTAKPGEEVTVKYRISTPASVPAGGQYAVLFAHTLSSTTTSSGIKTEASPGLVVYGRSTGETILKATISDAKLNQVLDSGTEKSNAINASARVKNEGNVDFMAVGQLKVEGIFGRVYYETPSTQGRISVIPESELVVSDTWEETPYFGFFKATWTVTAADGEEVVSRFIALVPAPVIIVTILLLTIITIWIIILVRKRKERRSRYSM